MAWVALSINPVNRAAWWLENLMPFVTVPLTIVTFRRFRFSDRAYVHATVFMVLHAIGAHYTYALTPLGDWLRAALDLSRNHYDRVVHFSFGLLLFPAARELFLRAPARVPTTRQLGLTLALMATASTVYELIEWLTAIMVDPDAGIAFLATQGDEWDAQKDMTCASAGSLLAAVLERRHVLQRRDDGKSV